MRKSTSVVSPPGTPPRPVPQNPHRTRVGRKNSDSAALRARLRKFLRKISPESFCGRAAARTLKEISGSAEVSIDFALLGQYVEKISTYSRSKGASAGEPLQLQDFQLWILTELVGRRRGGEPATSLALIELGRGNGKTELLAAYAVARCELSGRAEDVRFVATAYRQAEESWRPCLHFGAAAAGWDHGFRSSHRGDSTIQPMASRVPTLQGLTPSLVVLDEASRCHDQGMDALVSSLGKRIDAQLVTACTPDPRNHRSPYQAYRRRALEALAGDQLPEHWTALLWAASPDDDPGRPATWRKANPGMGSILPEHSLRQQYRTLYQLGGERRQEFLEQHLCLAQVESVQLLDLADYRACAVPSIDWRELAGREAVVALDMAAGGLQETIDLASLSWGVWQGETLLVGMKHFLPATDKAAEIGKARGLPILDWLASGAVQPAGQRAIDFGLITQALQELAGRFRLAAVGVDPVCRQAADIEREWLQRAGWPVERVPQTITHMAPYWALALDMFRRRQLRLVADPVLEVALQQTRAVVSPSGLARPVKHVGHGLADPVMALTMLVGLASRHRAAGDYSPGAAVVC